MASRAEWQERMDRANSRICHNAKELEAAFADFCQAAREDMREAVAACVFRNAANLIRRTPIDTGRARSGWHIGREASEWKPAVNEIINNVEAELGHSLENLLQGQADVIHIMNNVEYMLALEAGWSRQGAGFFALFVAELAAELERAARASRRGYA